MEMHNYFIKMKMHSTMKMRTIFWSLALATLLFAGCQGGPFCIKAKGDEVTQTIPMADFDGIELAIDGNVKIHRDSVLQVKITGSQNIIDNIERNIVDGSWHIEYDECVSKSGKLEIEIWMPSLRNVKIAGSGNITGLDEFSGESTLNVAIAGSGNIDLDANAPVVRASIAGSGNIDLGTVTDQLDASIAGSGDMNLHGSARNLELSISGSGNFRAFELPSETASVTISGSGSCEVQVSTHLDIVISGSGDVYYKGTPTVDLQTTGSGTVKHVN